MERHRNTFATRDRSLIMCELEATPIAAIVQHP
jgi:hypothetical protein